MTDEELIQKLDHGEKPIGTAWKPEPGDTVVGEVIWVGKLGSRHSGDVMVLTLSTQSGEVNVWAYWTVLQRELAKVDPKVGDHIAIKRLTDNREPAYRRYRVIVDSPEGIQVPNDQQD